MAGDWLKMEIATPEKGETLAITDRMGWPDPDTTVGKLFRVWRWFDQQTIDGNAAGITPSLLDRIAGAAGFAEAMQSVGWLVITAAGISLPNFERHNGETSKVRAETARRVAKHRRNTSSNGDVTRNVLPRPVVAAVKERDRYRCVYCGRVGGEYTPPEMPTDAVLCIDHVIPITRGGSDDMRNLVVACSACNMFKSNRLPDECGLPWPVDSQGRRMGNSKPVTPALPREREEREKKGKANPPVSPRKRGERRRKIETFTKEALPPYVSEEDADDYRNYCTFIGDPDLLRDAIETGACGMSETKWAEMQERFGMKQEIVNG